MFGTLLILTLLAPTAVLERSIAQNTTSQAEGLALHLKKLDVKMYGAFWCPACGKQKEIFGDRAFQYINYIECDPRGENPQPQLCRNAQIRAYPTWEIGNKKYEGVQSLRELAELSGYLPLLRN
jgi:hypothetical protein